MQMPIMAGAAQVPVQTTGQSELPLIDDHVMNDWCADMERADVLAILARVPDETNRALDELDRAIAGCDHDLARRSAHRLKGMANNLGAVRLAQSSRAIELGSRNIDDVSSQMPALRQIVAETLTALHAYR